MSVFIGVSPLFEVRLEAYLLGIGLFGAGAWLLAGKDLRDTIRLGLRAARQARNSSKGFLRGPARGAQGRSAAGRNAAGRNAAGRSAAGSPPLLDQLLPVKILKLAQQQGGVLTVARVAMELNVPLDQAQAGLDECVRAGNALPDYDLTHGHALYRFPEFSDPDRQSLP